MSNSYFRQVGDNGSYQEFTGEPTYKDAVDVLPPSLQERYDAFTLGYNKDNALLTLSEFEYNPDAKDKSAVAVRIVDAAKTLQCDIKGYFPAPKDHSGYTDVIDWSLEEYLGVLES